MKEVVHEPRVVLLFTLVAHDVGGGRKLFVAHGACFKVAHFDNGFIHVFDGLFVFLLLDVFLFVVDDVFLFFVGVGFGSTFVVAADVASVHDHFSFLCV